MSDINRSGSIYTIKKAMSDFRGEALRIRLKMHLHEWLLAVAALARADKLNLHGLFRAA